MTRKPTHDEAKLIMLGMDLEPLVPFESSGKPWLSICLKCSKEVSPRLSDIKQGHSGCKYCAAVSLGFKNRLVNDPIKLSKVMKFMASRDLEPLEPFTKVDVSWKCKCLKCDSVIQVKYSSLVKSLGGCSKCSRIEQGARHRLNENSAIEVMKSRNLLPLDPYPGSMKPWKSKCLDCGNEISPRYAHIQQGRKGCKFCASKKHSDSRRLSQEAAIAIAQKGGFEPLEKYRGRHYAWKCRCMKCKKVMTPQLGGIIAGNGCKYCAGLIVNPKEAFAVMKKANLEPLVSYPGAGTPWLCKCMKCNREVTPRYSSVNNGIGGCKYCATHGFDFSLGGIIYLITNTELNAHKIGITNESAKEKRLIKHANLGWVVYETAYCKDGNIAYEAEQEVINWLRNELGLGVFLSSKEMPQGGHTETVDSNEVDLITIWNKVLESIKKAEKDSKPLKLKTTMPKRQKQSKGGRQ